MHAACNSPQCQRSTKPADGCKCSCKGVFHGAAHRDGAAGPPIGQGPELDRVLAEVARDPQVRAAVATALELEPGCGLEISADCWCGHSIAWHGLVRCFMPLCDCLCSADELERA